jgi:hypothetical protein
VVTRTLDWLEWWTARSEISLLQQFADMPQVVLEERNVFIYDASVTPPTIVAGCHQFDNQPTSNSELYMCLSICFREPRQGEFRLMAEDQSLLPNDGGTLRTGNYFVVTSGLLL